MLMCILTRTAPTGDKSVVIFRCPQQWYKKSGASRRQKMPLEIPGLCCYFRSLNRSDE